MKNNIEMNWIIVAAFVIGAVSAVVNQYTVTKRVSENSKSISILNQRNQNLRQVFEFVVKSKHPDLIKQDKEK